MTTNLRPLAAIAAVIVVAVAGLAVIVGLTSRGGVAAPSRERIAIRIGRSHLEHRPICLLWRNEPAVPGR